jgi:hypothetical protein
MLWRRCGHRGLHVNNFSGAIPSSLGTLKYLRALWALSLLLVINVWKMSGTCQLLMFWRAKSAFEDDSSSMHWMQVPAPEQSYRSHTWRFGGYAGTKNIVSFYHFSCLLIIFVSVVLQLKFLNLWFFVRDVSSNKLEQSIPASFANMTKLKFL